MNGRYALCCRKDASFGAHHKNLNEDRPTAYYQRQKCRPMTLVSGDIRFMRMRIFAEVPWGGTQNDSGVVENGNFQRFRWLILQKL